MIIYIIIDIIILLLVILLLNNYYNSNNARSLNLKLKQLEEDFYIAGKQSIEEKLEKEEEELKERLKIIEDEICTKQKFNLELFKIREEELDRLLEETKRNKIIAMETAITEEITSYRKDYEEVLHDLETQILSAQDTLNNYKKKQEAIQEAILREKEKEEKENFYKIVMSNNDISDLAILKSIESQIVNKEILNKLIYESFIKRPLQELIKRITLNKKISGIYKITYIKTGEAYIGRSTDIGNRWKEHCLSSLNIGSIAHSTFHTFLANKGLENFTWEILEECDKEKCSEREKYWIDFYGTKNQLNTKEGG